MATLKHLFILLVPTGTPFSFTLSMRKVIASIMLVAVVDASTPLRAADSKESNHHIGKALPDYVTGDECLFCHRRDIASGWKVNAHQLTLRPLFAAPNVEEAVEADPKLQSLSLIHISEPTRPY